MFDSLSSNCCKSQPTRATAHCCVVIGEDLGTVPEGFRETLARWGLWTYRVMLFEREGDGRFRPPESYPANAVATFNTHDLPSFRGWISGHDLVVKHSIGVDPGRKRRCPRAFTLGVAYGFGGARFGLPPGRFGGGRLLLGPDAIALGDGRARRHSGRDRADQYSWHHPPASELAAQAHGAA
ncbi:MAG: 4-alpha-glucanotransferase [Pseudolabrys sp.]